ncbi:hypothetical protein Tco_1189259, partial [Tanacetum coccineum]
MMPLSVYPAYFDRIRFYDNSILLGDLLRLSMSAQYCEVQMDFARKYGKEFMAAVTELMPEHGVSRQ